jgi:signal transduction histidine kinase
MAIVLLIISQMVWVRQLMMRDKVRYEMELKQSLQSIVPFCLSRELSKKGDALKQDFELIPLEPSKLPPGAIIRGSFDTKEYQSDKNLGSFLVGAFAEELLHDNKIPLEPIDSLFRTEFAHYPDIADYSMSLLKGDSVMRELHADGEVYTVLRDDNAGVTVNIPLGETGTYRYRAHVMFKPTVYTQRLRSVATLSAMAVVIISLLVLYQLVQLRRKTAMLDAYRKAVIGIAHDLKSPLSYVYTMLGIFEKNETFAEKKAMLQTSKTRVKYLSEKIEVLLSTVKNGNNVLQIVPANYPFTQRCNEIIKELEVIYAGKKISCSIEPASDVVVQADPVYFDGCVRNLLDNAIKYSGENPMVKITAKTTQGKAILTFTDNGKGIEEKERKKVFREFYRSDSYSSIKDHGIGLAFVKQVVNAHKGKISLESSPGKGSTFTITLPQ